MGAKAWTAKCRSTTSSAKSAPAMGALKLAETAAATAQPSRSRPVIPSAFIRSDTQVEITAARCTTGPSRPEDPPEPSVIIEASGRGEPRLHLHPPIVQRGALDHVGHRAHAPVGREPMQDQPHHQPARDRDQQDHEPRQALGETVDRADVVDAVKRLLQRLDPLAEEQRGEPGGDPDQQRDEPEGDLPRPLVAQHLPAPATGGADCLDLVPHPATALLGHVG
jgi:hypothetical protein